ncbi:MAG TPA: hypothetical protein VK557_08590 [Pyrinomonadaceae bacterium]|nr:hypothetical protein [Pyrinomonadaceae bacterium]
MDKVTVITTAAGAVSALAVAVSLILLLLQLKRMRFTQEVTVALGLYDRSTSPEMLAAASWVKSTMPEAITYDDFQRDPAARGNLERLWYYFEFLGVLVGRGYVNEDMIFDQQGAFIAGIWDKTRHLIIARRQDRKSPQYMENFEILRNRFQVWANKNAPKLSLMDKRRVEAYYDGDKVAPALKNPDPAQHVNPGRLINTAPAKSAD